MTCPRLSEREHLGVTIQASPSDSLIPPDHTWANRPSICPTSHDMLPPWRTGAFTPSRDVLPPWSTGPPVSPP
jgi:hypothetical protein